MDINLLKALFSRIADYFPDNIFHEGKGHSATRERAFFVSFENLGAALAPLPLPPASYAPDSCSCYSIVYCNMAKLINK
jgi:hypothetical protein